VRYEDGTLKYTTWAAEEEDFMDYKNNEMRNPNLMRNEP